MATDSGNDPAAWKFHQVRTPAPSATRALLTRMRWHLEQAYQDSQRVLAAPDAPYGIVLATFTLVKALDMLDRLIESH